MDRDELRNAILDLIDDETLVDSFLDRVDSANETAMTRIARANTESTEESTDETPVEETVEDEDTVDEVDADVVEEDVVEEDTEEDVEVVETEDDETVDEGDIEIVLDETFVHDLVASPEFTRALRGIVDRAVEGLKAELETRFRGLETVQQEEREWQQDTPARKQRGVVSYRPRSPEQEANAEPQTMAEQAADSVGEIFD